MSKKEWAEFMRALGKLAIMVGVLSAVWFGVGIGFYFLVIY